MREHAQQALIHIDTEQSCSEALPFYKRHASTFLSASLPCTGALDLVPGKLPYQEGPVSMGLSCDHISWTIWYREEVEFFHLQEIDKAVTLD